LPLWATSGHSGLIQFTSLPIERDILRLLEEEGQMANSIRRRDVITLAVGATLPIAGPLSARAQPDNRLTPYLTLSLAGTRRDAGVSVAEVNLKLVQDIVTRTKVGERGLR
jgi:hypothetical protein